MAKRVSISSAQAQEGAAAELVALLQTVTADGKISNDEIKALHRWTRENQDCGLPGMQILRETIESICADGRVSTEERDELAKVIERVLPPDLRDLAKQRRRLEALAQKERTRAEAAAAMAEAERRAPALTFDFLVAGVAYENRAFVTARMSEDQPVFIIRDRRNQFSPNAIEVRTQEGFPIGFVPEEDAGDLAPLLDQGYRHIAWVKKIWLGRNFPIPVVIAEIYRPNTARTEAIREDEVPTRRIPAFTPPPLPHAPVGRRSCLIPLVLCGLTMLLAGWSAMGLL